MDLLLTKTPPDEIKNSVLPMVYRALEAPSTQIQVWKLHYCLASFLEQTFLCSKDILFPPPLNHFFNRDTMGKPVSWAEMGKMKRYLCNL